MRQEYGKQYSKRSVASWLREKYDTKCKSWEMWLNVNSKFKK